MLGHMSVGLLALLVALASAERAPRTLHERTCVGLWLPAVHLHGVCIIDVTNRSNCSEIARLFEVENPDFDPIELNQLPNLLVQRALEDHALKLPGKRQLCANINTKHHERPTGCSAGYQGYKGKCYTATKRRVSYQEAERECGNVHGTLVKEYEDDVISLLEELVKYYIKADTFTGYREIDDMENNPVDNLEGTHVEVDYETDRLQYVVQREKRGFFCVVNANISTQPLFEFVSLPATYDDVVVHDLNPVRVKPSVERYLVDLLQFRCEGNFTDQGVQQSSVTIHRADLTDFDENLPYGCRYAKSRGNVVFDLANPTHEPKELKGVCKSLVRLYRVYDRDYRVEDLGTHPRENRQLSFGAEPREQLVSVGYCAAKKGDCGASIPLYGRKSKVPICYLFKSHRDLDLELREGRPLRYIQIANRLEKLYTSQNYVDHDVTAQLDPATHYHSTAPKRVGSLIGTLVHKQLDKYCKKHLSPLYRVKDLKHKNEFLTTEISEVKQYRKDRDHFTEEELMGYCTKVPGYCGASQPLHHYRFINRREDRHSDDAYYAVAQPVSEKVEHDITCYIF